MSWYQVGEEGLMEGYERSFVLTLIQVEAVLLDRSSNVQVTLFVALGYV